jgi:hypothetical protein
MSSLRPVIQVTTKRPCAGSIGQKAVTPDTALEGSSFEVSGKAPGFTQMDLSPSPFLTSCHSGSGSCFMDFALPAPPDSHRVWLGRNRLTDTRPAATPVQRLDQGDAKGRHLHAFKADYDLTGVAHWQSRAFMLLGLRRRSRISAATPRSSRTCGLLASWTGPTVLTITIPCEIGPCGRAASRRPGKSRSG